VKMKHPTTVKACDLDCPNSPLYRAFLKAHRENPEVWRFLVSETHKVIARGFQNYSIASVWERMRWHTEIEMGETFKCNNNHRPYYARMFNETYPQYGGGEFFRVRELGVSRQPTEFD
jgi:hypothetical protein